MSRPSSRASAAHRGRRRRRRTRAASTAAGAAAAGAERAPREMSTTSAGPVPLAGIRRGPRLARLEALHDRRRARWRGSCAAGGAAAAGRRSRAPAPRRRSTVEHGLADGDLVAGLDVDRLDRARHVRRHFDRRLVGLELDDRLIDRQRVADLDEHAQHVAALHVLAELGDRERHRPARRPRRRRRGGGAAAGARRCRRPAGAAAVGAASCSATGCCADGRGCRLRAGCAPARSPLRPRASPSSVSTACPTCTLSPVLTLIATTVPATLDGTSMVALSVSSSSTGWSLATVVADLDQHAQHVAALDVLPEFGNSKFGRHAMLRSTPWLTRQHVSAAWRGFFFSGWISKSLSAFCTTFASIFFSSSERRQRREDDEARIDLEEVAQRRRGSRCGRSRRCRARAAGAAASDRSTPAAPSCSRTRRRRRRARRRASASRRAPSARSPGCSMFQRSAREPVAIELVVAGDAPHVGGDVVLLLEDLLRLQHLAENRAAAEQLRLQLRLLLLRRLQAVEALAGCRRCAPSGIGGIAYCSFITVR